MPSIGEFYEGGNVFIDSNNIFIVAPSNQVQNNYSSIWSTWSTGYEFGCFNTSNNWIEAGAYDESIGSGYQNTVNILNTNCTPYVNPNNWTAAHAASNYSFDSNFNDWFLPSKDELYLLAQSNVLLNPTGIFWSSTEIQGTDSGNDCWAYNFDNNIYPTNQLILTDKRHTLQVIPIRMSQINNIDTTNCVWVSNSGWNYITVTTANGITATDSVYVSLNAPVYGFSSVSACETYTWEGQTITSSGDLTHTYQNTLGCDSIHTISVTINNPTTGYSSVSVCETYTWEGQTITSSGDLTHTYQNTLGCDSIHTISVTINNPTTGSSSVSACETYTWEGQTITSSGDLTHTYQNILGCDSIHTISVTINNPTTGYSSVSAYETYTWEGQTITSSGDLTHTYQNTLGCDSIHTLTVEINNTTTSTTFEEMPAIVMIGTRLPYNSSGTYTYNTINSNGCDSIATLELVISSLEVDDVTTNTSCFGNVDGSAEITVLGGILPYNYSWSSGEISQDLTNVPAGNYILTVIDSNDCNITHNITIDEPQDNNINPNIINTTCEVSDDASNDINPYEGTTPYTFLWSNGQITEDLNNIQIGEYSILVTDFNGCQKTNTPIVDFDGSDDCLLVPNLFTPNGDGIHDT